MVKTGHCGTSRYCANLNLTLPAHFLWDLYQSQTADNFSEPLDRDALAVRTFKVLDTIESPIIRDYLANAPKSQSTQYSLAQQIGSVLKITCFIDQSGSLLGRMESSLLITRMRIGKPNSGAHWLSMTHCLPAITERSFTNACCNP